MILNYRVKKNSPRLLKLKTDDGKNNFRELINEAKLLASKNLGTVTNRSTVSFVFKLIILLMTEQSILLFPKNESCKFIRKST